MSWEARIFSVADGRGELVSEVDRLILSQRARWPAYDRAVAALSGMAGRELAGEGFRVVIKSNPRRSVSIYAKVDPAAVAERPCFLCEENLPVEEQGIAFGAYALFPNPYPVHFRHLTIPHRQHRPQALAGELGSLLGLAVALGPELIVFYNGPRCGASAPDHLHFQACQRAGVPLCEAPPAARGQAGMEALRGFGRNALRFQEGSVEALIEKLERAIAALGRIGGEETEPMFNLFAWRQGEGLCALLFPRARHRPACYFASDEGRIAISPAALEMAGLVMIAEPAHLDRLDASKMEAIYREVTLSDERFERLVEALP